MDEIRLSFAGERFHLEHEVIALIEVAFITLPYYMSKMRRGRPLHLHTAPEKILDGGGERCSTFEENCSAGAASIGIIRHEIRNFSG